MRINIWAILILALVWVALNGGFTIYNAVIGVAVGMAAYFPTRYFMRPAKVTGVNFLRLITYPFFLIGQIYISGWVLIKMIIFGCKVEVVRVETLLKNDFLRALLCNSITLIPGSVMLQQEESQLTVMLLREKNAQPFESDCDIGYEVKGKPEQRLLKAER